MVAAVYTRLRKTSLRLIKKYGRPVTIKFAVDAAPPDPTKPWNPAAPTFTTYVTVGVVTPAEEKYVDGMTVLETDEQIIVPALGMPAVPDPKSIVLDGTVQYKVVKVNGVDPGTVAIIYTIMVRR